MLVYIYALHDYPPSTWFMTFLSVWDTHSFPYSNSHSSIDPFLILIFLDVFKTLLCIFHFIAIFLIQLGCIVWSQTTISLYYVCSSTKLVIRSRIQLWVIRDLKVVGHHWTCATPTPLTLVPLVRCQSHFINAATSLSNIH